MYNIIMFDTEEDLLKLTGIDDERKLWDLGFNLDDWDAGFCCDKPLDHVYDTADSEEIEEEYEYDSDSYAHDAVFEDEHRVPNDNAWWLVRRMEDYCVGYHHVEYNGKHYYTVHHS